MKTPKTYTVVTGAGKGLGKAFAEELASRHRNLLLVALPNEGLGGLAQRLRTRYPIDVQYLEVDFSDSHAVEVLAQWLKDYRVDMLLNNAGIGSSKSIESATMRDVDAIIQVNIRTLTLLTCLLIPELKRHANSYILNISSLSCCLPVAYKTVYPASKSFIYSFSRSLCEELKDTGIHVGVVLPGPIKTNKEVSDRIDQHGWWVRESLLTPAQIASLVITKTFNKQKVIIPGKINKVNWLLTKLLPKSVQIPLLSNVMKQEVMRGGNLQPVSLQLA